MVLLSAAKVFPAPTPPQVQAASGFVKNLPTSPERRCVFFTKILRELPPTFLWLLKQNSSYRLRYSIKKKSDVMRTIEKINRKQESINLPFSIKLVVKIVATAVGFYVWGVDFIWVVLGVVFCWNILKGIASCLFSLIALIGFFWFLFTYIF